MASNKDKKADINLSVLVKSTKGNVIANAKIELIDGSGEKNYYYTNEAGLASEIPLSRKGVYSVSASLDDKVSKTSAIKGASVKGKNVKRTLLINTESSGAVTVAGGSEIVAEYQFYFKYNRNKIDETEETWISFLSKVAELSKERSVVIDIYSSASTVPTRAYKNNKQLASSRAKKTQELLESSISKTDANKANVLFKRHSHVHGPRYAADYMNRKKYEPYQYVKLKLY
ncbi:MAG: hypothetical protein AB7O73_06285, partial [Bacteroidia bacterium]